jgi:tripartite-type tricarboxylate transporter receptor subunit TctC
MHIKPFLHPLIKTLSTSLVLVLGAMQSNAWAQNAASQNFPSKPIKIIVPNAAGGGADMTARAVAQRLVDALGQSVVIDNKPSAGGVIAGELVAKAEPDGHTVLLISSGTAVSAALFKTLPFDTLRDFAPVSMLATFDLVMAVSEAGRFKTVAELLAWARVNPGKLNIGTPQMGSTQNLAAELLKTAAGIDAQIVPFNGTPPVITALRGGEIDAMVDILGPLMPQITAKALRPMAVLSTKRSAYLPDVPALRELGGSLANFEATSWNGLAVPAKTPKDVVAKLNREIQAVLAQPELKKRLADAGLTAHGSSPEQLTDLLASEIKRWSAVMSRAHIARQ